MGNGRARQLTLFLLTVEQIPLKFRLDGKLCSATGRALHMIGKRRCPKCERILDLSAFHVNAEKSRGHHSYCKQCAKIYYKEYRQSRKRMLMELMGGKCSRCGYDKALRSLDFHHIENDEKEVNVSQMIARGYKDFEILKELDKCILLCRNCHGEIHEFGELEWKEKRDGVGWEWSGGKVCTT